MNRIPSEDQIRQHFTDLRRACTEKAEKDVIDIAQRARSGSSEVDGFKSNHGLAAPGGGGMRVKIGTTRQFAGFDDHGNEVYDTIDVYDTIPASSVEMMALGSGEPDEMHKHCTTLFDMLQQAAASSRGVVNTRDRINEYQRPEKPIGQTSTPCKVGPCDSPAVKNGFCDTDNRFNLRYTAEHNEPAPIGLLEENARARQPQKRRQTA